MKLLTAIVKDNVDIDKNGKIEVYVPSLMTKMSNSDPKENKKTIKTSFKVLNKDMSDVKRAKVKEYNTIPAYPATYTSEKFGQYLVPDKDDEVFIFFKDDNYNVAYYLFNNSFDSARLLDFGELIDDTSGNGDAAIKPSQKVLLRTKTGNLFAANDNSNNPGVIIRGVGSHKIKMFKTMDMTTNKILIESGGGHTITFDDVANTITVSTKRGHKLVLDDILNGINLTTVSENRITLDDNLKLIQLVTASGTGLEFDDVTKKLKLTALDALAECSNSIKLDSKAQMDLNTMGQLNVNASQGTLETKATLDLKSGMINIESQGTLSIKANGPVSVESAAMCTVKGEMVTVDAKIINLGQGAASALIKGTEFLTFFNTHMHTCPPMGGPSTPPIVPMTPNMLSLTCMTT